MTKNIFSAYEWYFFLSIILTLSKAAGIFCKNKRLNSHACTFQKGPFSNKKASNQTNNHPLKGFSAAICVPAR